MIGLWVLPDFVLVSMLLTLAVNCLRAACSRDGRLFAQKNPPALVLLCAAAAGVGALFLAQNAFETDALQTNVVPVVNIVLLGAVLNKLLTDSADEKKRLRKTNQTTPKEPASPQEAPVSDGKAPTSHKDSGS